jgi:hypothetical protein
MVITARQSIDDNQSLLVCFVIIVHEPFFIPSLNEPIWALLHEFVHSAGRLLPAVRTLRRQSSDISCCCCCYCRRRRRRHRNGYSA